MKSQSLHTVSCNISWSCCRGNLIMITLGSERVEFHHPGQLLVDDPVFRRTRRRSPLIWTGHTLSTNGHRRAAEKRSSQTLQSKVLIRPCGKLGWNGESRWIGIFGRHFGIHKYQISFKTWPSPTVYGGWPSKQLKERKKVLSWSHARRARFAQETACHWLTRVAPPPGDSCSGWHFPLQRPRQPPTRCLGWRSTSCRWKRVENLMDGSVNQRTAVYVTSMLLFTPTRLFALVRFAKRGRGGTGVVWNERRVGEREEIEGARAPVVQRPRALQSMLVQLGSTDRRAARQVWRRVHVFFFHLFVWRAKN